MFPTSAGKGDYELVNLVSGTWDLAFGVRDDFGGPFSKVLIARDQALPKGSASFNADFASAKAFTPGSKSLSLRNLEAEQTHVSVVYALNNATTGLEIGPANDPDNAIVATVDFPTVPSSLQKESDRYRVSAITVADTSSQRGAVAVFHEATDVALDLPPEVSAPTAKGIDGRIATTMKTRAGSEVYEARVFSKVSNQSSREWRVSTSASLVSAGGIGGAQPSEIALIPPDLSNVGDFKSVWLTPAGIACQVTAAVHEEQIPLGDGHVARFAQSSITMDSP